MNELKRTFRSKKNSARKTISKAKNENRLHSLAYFFVKFFAIFFALNYIIGLLDLSFITNFLASFSSAVLGLKVTGSTVFLSSSQFTVTNFCTGFTSGAILAAVIFSLRKPALGKKSLLLIFGLILLFLVNIPRIILVLFAAKYGFDAELVHEFTWFLMSAAVLAIWYYGTKRLAGIKDFSELI